MLIDTIVIAAYLVVPLLGLWTLMFSILPVEYRRDPLQKSPEKR